MSAVRGLLLYFLVSSWISVCLVSTVHETGRYFLWRTEQCQHTPGKQRARTALIPKTNLYSVTLGSARLMGLNITLLPNC